MSYDIEYAGLKSTYRRRVQDALNDIRTGAVDEEDLDKLHNFCMVSLMLMTKVNKATWRNAERMAELADLLQEAHILKAENRYEHELECTSTTTLLRSSQEDVVGGSNRNILEHSKAVEQIKDSTRNTDS